MKLFTIDDKTKLPVANPELLTIDCFNKLMRRVKKIDGDFDGRKKVMNEKELAWIYFQEVYDSRFKLKEGEEKDKAVKALIGLPPDWKEDELVKQCRAEYAETQVSASSDYVLSLEGTVQALSQYLKNAKKEISSGNLTTVEPKAIKDLMAIINDSPQLMETVVKTKAVLRKEQDALATGKKGRTINKFELGV